MLTLTIASLYQDFKDEIGSPVSEVFFIRQLNRLLIQMRLTKPAERLQKIYFNKEFRKYALEADYRDTVSLRDTSRVFNDRPFHRTSPSLISQRSFGELYAIQGSDSVQFMEILHQRNTTSAAFLTKCDSLTDDGVWASISNASNIQLNTTTKHDGAASVSFDITAAASAEISFTKTSVIDTSAFTEHQGNGFFMWLPTLPTQVTIKWGNDATNFFSKTVTTQASGEAFITTDKNEFRVDRNDATETGSVDLTNMVYWTVTLTFSSAITDTDFLIDHIALFKPNILTHEYYSSFVAKNSSGILQAKITESTGTSDLPLIFDDYQQTVIDGLAWRYFNRKKRELALDYKRDFISTLAPSGALISGLRLLNRKYPDMSQHIRRIPRLPSL